MCPLSVSREIVKDGEPGWRCPCDSPSCSSYREEVSFLDGVTDGKGRLVIIGAATIIILMVLMVSLMGGDPSEASASTLRRELESLSAKLGELEEKPQPPKARSPLEVPTLEAGVVKTVAAVGALQPGEQKAKIEDLLTQIRNHRTQIERFKQAHSDSSQSGPKFAEAIRLVKQFEELEGKAEAEFDDALLNYPEHADVFEDLILAIRGELKKARGLAVPSSPQGGAVKKPDPRIARLESDLSQAESALKSYEVSVPVPFPLAEASLRLAASPEIARSLVVPWVTQFCGDLPVANLAQETYFDSKITGKVVVRTMSTGDAFEGLASGQLDVIVADRMPTVEEQKALGGDLLVSRSVAEVVAMDALTFLVNPDCQVDTFEVWQPQSLPIMAGGSGSPVGIQVGRFGLATADDETTFGEDAAMSSASVLGASLYHLERENLRARRLPVKSSPEAVALKPSPFTIATEDYRYSFRIVAWTPQEASANALDFIKFATSDKGQATAETQGYVDLRLRPIKGDIDPTILAALGEAIGADKVSSAERLSTNLRFETGESALDLKAQADLERLPRFVARSYPSYKVVILGFTDSTGGPEVNIPLSKERAETVASELRKSKVSSFASGLGSSFPLDTNSSEEGKARNRRAEVWVVKQ